MRKLAFLFFLFPGTLMCQSHWGLKTVLQGSRDGYKDISASANNSGGEATFALVYNDRCTEQYTVSWDFGRDISRVQAGESFQVSLKSVQGSDCMTGRSASIQMATSGKSASDLASKELNASQVVNGFNGVVGKAYAGSTTTGAITVTAAPVRTPKALTWIKLDISAKTAHSNHRPHSASHEILYVFEEGYNVGGSGATISSSACARVEQDMARIEDDLKKPSNEYDLTAGLWRGFQTTEVVLGDRYDIGLGRIVPMITFTDNWPEAWSQRLSSASSTNNEAHQELLKAEAAMEQIADMAWSWAGAHDIEAWEAQSRMGKIEGARQELITHLENAVWALYCRDLRPLMKKLDKLDTDLYACDGAKYEELAIRFESIRFYSDWRKNTGDYNMTCGVKQHGYE